MGEVENGRNLYEQLVTDIQDPQGVKQLTLTMAVLISYRRLLPEISDNSHEPTNGSYLADLNTLFRGHSLKNSKRVRPLLQAFDGLSDQYLLRGFNDQPHASTKEKLSLIKLPELRISQRCLRNL